MSEQDYIPGTAVIRNLVRRDENSRPYGTTDPRELDAAEDFYVSTRLAELRGGHFRLDPEVRPFSFGHMRRIHQHLFQDVYAWAGEPRRVPMTKHVTAYAQPSEMNALLRAQYTGLAQRDYLRGISDRRAFAEQLAGVWAEINHAHAFREGNTRSQTVFFEQLAHEAGWRLDVARLTPRHPLSVYGKFVAARFEHQRLRGTAGFEPGSPASATGPGAPQPAQQLADVLHGLTTPDSSPEARLRRGEAGHGVQAGGENHQRPETRPGQALVSRSGSTARRARFPELQGMRLDPYGSADDPAPGAGDDYQP